MPLRIQKRNATEKDLAIFCNMCQGITDPDKREMAESIMRASVQHNMGTYMKMKREEKMKDVIMEVFGDVIDELANERANERVEKLANERVEQLTNERVEKIAKKRAKKLAEKLANERTQKFSEETAREMLADHQPESLILKYSRITKEKLMELASSMGVPLVSG